MFNLGDQVKCKVTGYTGVVTSITQFINGCTRLALQAKVGKDSKVPDAIYVDEPQAEMVKKKYVKPTVSELGGPLSFMPKK